MTSSNHWFESSVAIGESGLLVTESGDEILFGKDSILVDFGNADSGFRENQLISVKITNELFSEDSPCVGSAVSSKIYLKMVLPFGIEKTARIAVFVRATNGIKTSEWIPQGVYYVDTRKHTKSEFGTPALEINGYDAMMLTEKYYPSDDSHDYPMMDIDMVDFIASKMTPPGSISGVSVDQRTYDIMTLGYKFSLPAGYSMREVLCMIAASYGGNFIISPAGELRLVRLNEIPMETSILITEDGYEILFGDDTILI